jgi:acetoin utilization protein AcuB
MYVRDWMTAPVLVTPAFTPVMRAIEFMTAHKIRRLPVVQGGTLVGIVTRADLQNFLGDGPGGSVSADAMLGDMMKAPVVTVTPHDTLERASAVMLQNEISGLPVVEGLRPVGMVTESDIFRAFNEILGTLEDGARIVLAIPPEANPLDNAYRQLSGMNLSSLAIYRLSHGRGWEAVARVSGISSRTPKPQPWFVRR